MISDSKTGAPGTSDLNLHIYIYIQHWNSWEKEPAKNSVSRLCFAGDGGPHLLTRPTTTGGLLFTGLRSRMLHRGFKLDAPADGDKSLPLGEGINMDIHGTGCWKQVRSSER